MELSADFDFDQAFDFYNQESIKFLKMIPLKSEGKEIKVTLKGTVFTNGVNVAHFDSAMHSLGVAFESSFLDTLDESLKSILGLPDTITIRPFMKKYETQNVAYLKLKHKDGKYRFTSDIAMNQKKPEKIALIKGQEIAVEIKPMAYVNFKESFAGVSIEVVKIVTKL